MITIIIIFFTIVYSTFASSCSLEFHFSVPAYDDASVYHGFLPCLQFTAKASDELHRCNRNDLMSNTSSNHQGGHGGRRDLRCSTFHQWTFVRIGTQKPTMDYFTFLVEAFVGGAVAGVTSPAERLIRTVFLKSRRCNWPAQQISCSGLQHSSGLGNGRV